MTLFFGLSSVSLLVIFCSSLSQLQAASEDYYIETNSLQCGTEHPCLTLSQFAANSSHYLHSDSTVTLIFLPGTHHLSKVNLTLSNMESFTMKTDNSTAQILCKKDTHIYFSQSLSIHITNLEFIGCPATLKHVAEFVVENSKFEGREKSGTALELIETIAAQIINSTFDNVTSEESILKSISSTVTIEASEFNGNSVTGDGGILDFTNSIITIKISEFDSNTAPDGGVLTFFNTAVTIEASEFRDNFASQGSILASINSTITIEVSEFRDNLASQGSIFTSINSTITIEASEFDGNFGREGGVLSSFNSSVMIEGSKFDSNSADSGGVLSSTDSTTITVGDCNFTNNTSSGGAVIDADSDSKIYSHGYLLIDKNLADDYAVIFLSGSEFRAGNSSGNFTFSNNFGSILALNSNMTFSGYAEFVTNQPSKTPISPAFQEGGAITLFQSNVFFDGQCIFEHNHAENGGAIYSTESKLYVRGNVTIAHNNATANGGGVYLSTSELYCEHESTFVLNNNVAVNKGGGLHAISSSFKASSAILELDAGDDNDKELLNFRYIGTRINFTNNVARFGGGLSLEENARLYILKYDQMSFYENDINTVLFISNSAEYGGAVYVDDNTNSGTCVSDPKTECFFQVLAVALFLYTDSLDSDLNLQSAYFSQNYASISGSTLYGGLLDRCAVSQFAEMYMKYIRTDVDRGGGIAYFRNISNITEVSISSGPVRVCLCTDYILHDCTFQGHYDVKKGEMFPVSLVAVDQVGQPVNATVQASLSSAESGLAEGQLVKNISAECTNLTFNVVSPHDSEILALYASDGPCRNVKLSRASVEIHFLPCSCSIGLQVRFDDTNCTCECHRNISQYMEPCDSGSLVKKPQSRAWISYINDTNLTGYLVCPNCPFDYCLSNRLSPPIDLNQPNGADAQCAFNRSSLLCGSCKPYTLSLGSSRCLPCSSYWPALLVTITIAAILAGIALVSLLLVLHMTVAVGTLNGLIFYANVVYANKSILLPFQETNFVTVFISWLNLDLGIDTCYFPRMDTYIKTWLQLAFPAYVIVLVILVIVISSYSTKFSNLIGRKDPVVTLSTLILLSYAKLLEVCFKSALSVIILDYPDGSSKFLWLPDATVEYLSGKHIPLFIAAVLILLVGLVYTALLFSWQCLFRLPKWTIFEWSRNPRILAFIETYHVPYTPKHRYWTGLLLIVRVVLYLVATFNVSNDPTVFFTAIIFTVCCIFALKQFFGSRLYRKWPVDVLETFFCLNILLFATFSWYSLNNPVSNQEAAAYTSVTITLFVLLLIILYHVYTYTNLFSKCKKTRPNPGQRRHYSPPPINDYASHVSDDRGELLDKLNGPIKTDDYNTPLIDPVRIPQPTYSVVEVQKPRDLAAVDPNAP